jgi:uncharacterized protein (DUF58 family)
MAQPLLTRFPMEGSVSGHHKSPHRGSSVEFAEYRNYVPGDDLRRLDWRVFARTDRFYLKEFDAETNLRCYIVLDCSGSMAFAAKHGSKFDYARRLAATLAYLIIHQGDAVGLVCIGEKTITEIPARRTPSHVQLLCEAIDAAKPQGETGLVQGLHQLAEKVRRRALVIVLSDFFTDAEPIVRAIQHVRYQKHDLTAFQLLDRQELEFTFDRPTRFQDLESSFRLVAEPALVRDEYLAQLRAFVDQLRTGCHEFKADYRQAATDQNYEAVLSDFLVHRALAASTA